MNKKMIEVEHTQVYMLVLNTFGSAESYQVAAISTDPDSIKQFYYDNLLPVDERIRDDAGFLHSFKQGPLYYLNPCGSLEPGMTNVFGHGVHEMWVPSDRLHQFCNEYSGATRLGEL